MSFDLDVGYASQRGPRSVLEDHAGVGQPAPHEEAWGVIAALADGVSAGGLGWEAAQTTVETLLRDYYATPATWDTTVALDRLIAAQNAWLADHNRRRQAIGGAQGRGTAGMTTLTAIVLRGHGYTLAHVGDTRAYLLRGGELSPLTQDHTLGPFEFQNGLTRAIGLDDALRVDYLEGDLQIGDTFVLTSDGVHGVIKPSALQSLAGQGSAQEASEALVAKALTSGGRDNATALVIRVKGLAAARLEDAARQGRQLPIPHKMQVGDLVDGMRIEACVFANGVHRLYKVRHLQSGCLYALKTLHEARASDPEERAMLAHEAWLGARVTEREARGLVRVHETKDATCFYALFDWHSGQTLGDLLQAQQRFPVGEIVATTTTVVRALGRLHQFGVIHRDVKPDNIHLGDDGQWRLLDLGVALSGKEPESLRVLHAGTPSYMNPEQWEDDPAVARVTAQSDLFALGVTLYQWLTGRLPYGEIEPYQLGRYRRDPVPPSRLRPDVPIWLDHVVLKAVARDRRQRFETAEELLLALERGASRPLSAPMSTPLLGRDPVAMWKIALTVSVLFNLLLVYWLAFLPRA
ncbi:MAG TPA: bifunctional protein-serine/threonine kinase/phosphatase [Aquabacterium sp.]|uniref:bifunctional protein-serine/threonine kinase/phosphatase n=1 Tax=Aquabacterium sp. TaxID=1872578 RepID=UPI002E308521|nr:bifunctional protein-serine/threonine kinase/phosphatase [Aquabacterium sp.]HEX5357845.1 bifunctional protein-serine/threonine kinase/phosphatase [Aquabacterium sp.]